tara:strand:+ start:1028 stop:1249 length:222 start_codon:yes stop_codon:yes gene_type:complete
MAQFLAGLTTGIYIGTHYDCKPILKIMVSTFNQYCPKKEPDDLKDDLKDKKEPVKEPTKEPVKEPAPAKNKWF